MFWHGLILNLPHDYSAFFARTFDVIMRIFFIPSDWWMATKRHIDCPALLNSIDLSIPKGTRSRSIFCRHYHLTSYAYNSKIIRLFRTGVSTNTILDFFDDSPNEFTGQINIILSPWLFLYLAVLLLLLSYYYFCLLLCCYLSHVLYTCYHFTNCILLYSLVLSWISLSCCCSNYFNVCLSFT